MQLLESAEGRAVPRTAEAGSTGVQHSHGLEGKEYGGQVRGRIRQMGSFVHQAWLTAAVSQPAERKPVLHGPAPDR